jgi:2-dehydro-3-deoxyphosphogluconate aldolase / (4S)-4-hydroxy-2-oxoglutarate aldolase
MPDPIPTGILAVIRAPAPEVALTVAAGLERAGVDAIELTFTIPDAAAVIAEFARGAQVPVGAGTVRSVEDCRAAAAAGATFIVSPDLNAAVVQAAHRAGLAAVPGALTPGEVGRCLDAGADAVKVFPVGAVGGPPYLRSLSEPFPGVRWVASGGVTPDVVQSYWDAGCATVCMGGALIDSGAAAAGDVEAVAEHARSVLERARRS